MKYICTIVSRGRFFISGVVILSGPGDLLLGSFEMILKIVRGIKWLKGGECSVSFGWVVE